MTTSINTVAAELPNTICMYKNLEKEILRRQLPRGQLSALCRLHIDLHTLLPGKSPSMIATTLIILFGWYESVAETQSYNNEKQIKNPNRQLSLKPF